MSLPLSVLIPIGDDITQVGGAIEQIRPWGELRPEILVICSPTMPAAMRRRLEGVWSASGVRCTAIAGASTAAVRNAAIEASAGDLIVFLESGDTIDPRYLNQAAERLAAQPDLGFVTAWAQRPGAAGLATMTKPALTVAAILAGRDPIPGPTVLRRATWEAAGRFDETLPSCEWYEFWIRVLASGGNGTVINAPLIGYAPSRTTAYRNALDPERHAAGVRQVFEKHIDLFRQHVATALCARESSLNELYAHYHHLLRRRDALVAARTHLLQRTEETTQPLRESGDGGFDWGDLRRLLPVSTRWGFERGTPIDRYYIERFLASHAADVRGAVLEVQEADYTRRFGGERVTCSDVIDINAGNARANLIGDLRRLQGIPSDSYDCLILTQTLHVIDDIRAVLREAMRILTPRGVLLATLPCASRLCLDYGRDHDFWRVTGAGARQVFGGVFPSSHVEVQTFGNMLANLAFLEGLAAQELSAEELETQDPVHPLLVAVRAVKPADRSETVCRRRTQGQAAVLLYHRVADAPLDVHGVCVKPADFRAHMTQLAKSYRPMPLAQLAMAAAEGWLPERAVAVTFDDGYVDNLEVASPILLELGIPATFFITSAGLLGAREFWWDVLASIFFSTAPRPAHLTIATNGDALNLPTATAEQRQHAHEVLYYRLRAAAVEDRERLLGHLRQWAGDVAVDETARPVNRRELQDLARRPGHSIGGHGTHHLWLSAQPQDVVLREVGDNRTLLEGAIGRIVTSFAYPFGDHDDQSVALVGDLGYRAAVTCLESVVQPGANPLRLPRIVLGPRDGSALEPRLQTLFAAATAISA